VAPLPAGSGPASSASSWRAAPDAGSAATRPGLAAAEVVVALAGDQPFAGTAVPRLVAALRAAPDGSSSRVDAVLGSDPGGRRQFLLAAYRAAPLRAALGTGGGVPTGRSMRSVVAGLRVTEIPVTAAEALDVDTADDLERARELARDELGSGA
jgi:molybdopterin-guanine dinucleotide biosynthesis protein A